MSRTRPKEENYRQMKSDIETVSNAFQKGKSEKHRIYAILKWRGAILDNDDPERADFLPYRPELIDEFRLEVEDNMENLEEDYKPAYLLELRRFMPLVKSLKDTLDEEKNKAKATAQEAHSNLSDMERDHRRPPEFEYSYDAHPGPDYPQRRQEAFEKHRIERDAWSNTYDGDEWIRNYADYRGGWSKATEYALKLDLLFDDLVLVKKIVAQHVQQTAPPSLTHRINSGYCQGVYNVLEPFVEVDQQLLLNQLIFEGKAPYKLIVHNCQQNILAYIFCQLLDKSEITGSQISVSRWICDCFTPATYDTIYDVVRGKNKPAKAKRILIGN